MRFTPRPRYCGAHPGGRAAGALLPHGRSYITLNFQYAIKETIYQKRLTVYKLHLLDPKL
jgi:hypothetical protein